MIRAALQKKLMNLYIFTDLMKMSRKIPKNRKELAREMRTRDRRVRALVKRAYEIPFYRKRFDEAGVRPEDIRISPEGELKARIVSKAYFGQYIRHVLEIGGCEIEQMDFTQSNAALQEGDEIAVSLVTDSLRLLPADDNKEI